MKKAISLMELLTIIKRNWYVLLASGLIIAALSFFASAYLMKPQYSATTNLLVSQEVTESQAMELGEIETNLRMIQTYRDVIQDSVVLDDVADKLNNQFTSEELRGKIEVNIQEDSQVFSLTAFADRPEMAALIANEVAISFQENIEEVISIENVAILSPAKSHPQSIYPNVPFHTIIGGIIGVLLGIVYALIKTVGDKKIRSESIIPELIGWNTIGVISSMEGQSKNQHQKWNRDQLKIQTKNMLKRIW